MKKREKAALISTLAQEIDETPHVYFVDASAMNVSQTNVLRRMCHAQDIRYKVCKNTLIGKALEAQKNKEVVAELPQKIFKGGTTAIFFEKEHAGACAKLIQAFRKQEGIHFLLLKAACIEEEVYTGESELDTLARFRSKEELLADTLALLLAPVQQVLSTLGSKSQELVGMLQLLAARKNAHP